MKIFNKTGRIFYFVFISLLIILAVLVFISILPLPNSFKIMTVMSSSMEPTIKTGELVVIQPVESYEQDEIITFKPRDAESNKNTTTHRISKKENDKFGAVKYITKGDANNTEDFAPVYHQQILGKYIFGVPYLGYLIGYIKTLPGLVLLVIIPATIIVYEESKKVHREAKLILKKRRAKKTSAKKSSKKSESDSLNKVPTKQSLSESQSEGVGFKKEERKTDDAKAKKNN